MEEDGTDKRVAFMCSCLMVYFSGTGWTYNQFCCLLVLLLAVRLAAAYSMTAKHAKLRSGRWQDTSWCRGRD
jgi:cell division protein FtsW (lipid II flippase)